MSSHDGAADLGRISTVRVSPASSSAAAPADDWAGRVIGGRYELLREIGRGGMGVVYEGRHVALRRPVAVKVLRPEIAHSEGALARFEREARAAAAIGSTHIVAVLDFGRESSGEAWMVMELLDGEDLRARLRREGSMTADAVRGLLRDVATALRDAHAKGIVHRDLKSENVLLVRRDGREVAKVVDFGISKFLADPSRSMVTARDVLLGTPQYMAPETADPDAPQDHRVDLYALGCIAFEALTGTLPFSGRTAVELLYQHTHAAVPSPSSRAKVPPELDAIVRRLLAKRPEQRFASAGALIEALDAPPRRVRPRVMAAAGLAVALLTMVAAAVATRSRGGSPAAVGAASAPGVSARPVAVLPTKVVSTRADGIERGREIVPAPVPPGAQPTRRRRSAPQPARVAVPRAEEPLVDGLRPSPY